LQRPCRARILLGRRIPRAPAPFLGTARAGACLDHVHLGPGRARRPRWARRRGPAAR